MSNDDTPIKQRLHITFGKSGALKYTSNLDIAKVWERVLRRAELPILYSAGFNPRPRLQLATALPLGITSECEILDVSLREPIALSGLNEQLLNVSPEGLDIYEIKDVPVRSAALQTRVRSAEYRIKFIDEIDLNQLRERIGHLLAAEKILVTRQKKGKETITNIRPLIHDLYLDDRDDLIAHLAVGAHGNARPDSIINELNLAEIHHSMHRFRLHLASET